MMKKTYITPAIHTYKIRVEKSLLAGSDISVGNNWESGNEVLSRQHSGSIWDDDEE